MGMSIKTCVRCSEEKIEELDFYYIDREKYGKSGYYDSSCKECRIEYNKNCRKKRLEHYNEIRRQNYRKRKVEGRQTKGCGDYRSSSSKADYIKRNPEKRLAHNRVSAAIKNGALTRPEECEICSQNCKPEAHHPDYREPLNVAWLCSGCHGKVHSALNYVRRYFGEEAQHILPEVTYAT